MATAPRFALQTLLLARVLVRRQHLGESARRSVATSAFGDPVADVQIGREWQVELPRVPGGDLDRETLRRVLRSSVPTVLEGAALDSRAVERWTPRFLAETHGDVSIPMFPEHTSAEHLSLAECIRHIEESRDSGVQVNNVCGPLTDPAGLMADLPLDRIRALVRGLTYHGANLFVSGAENGSKYHCANETNFFFQVHGEKEWFFVHPRYSAAMDPHFTTPRCNYFGSGVPWGFHPRGVPIGHTVLRPGDVLVNPPWWWHWVRNKTTTIGVATRWYSWRHRFGTDNPYFSFLQWLFPHQWKLLWTDYLRGGVLDDRKWVHRESALA